jgi:hypothetical protein
MDYVYLQDQNNILSSCVLKLSFGAERVKLPTDTFIVNRFTMHVLGGAHLIKTQNHVHLQHT